MQTGLLILPALALMDWWVMEKKWTRLRLVSKPAVIAALIVFFSSSAGWGGANLWFGLALVFSLLGDINLLLPERFFLPGLAAFLLAHVFYILGFNLEAAPTSMWAWLVAVPVAAAGWLIFRRLRGGVMASPEGLRMIIPVLVYCAIISLMLVSAWLCLFRPGWPLSAALLAGLGATLFFISDSVLGFNRFVRPTPHHDLVVMSTYHLGQIAIIAGVALYAAL